MKRFVVTLVIVSFFIGLLVMWIVRDRSRGFETEEMPWDGPQMIHGILDQNECNYIINKAESSFTRSSVVGIDGPDESRTSETAWIGKDDPVVLGGTRQIPKSHRGLGPLVEPLY